MVDKARNHAASDLDKRKSFVTGVGSNHGSSDDLTLVER